MKYCEECGAELEDNAEYCEECGTKQSTMQAANPIAQNESISKEKQAVSKDKKSLVIILVVVILAVLAVVVFWVISNKENSKSKDGQQTTEKDIVTNEAIVQPTEETTEEPDIQATEEPTEQPTPEPTEPSTPEPTEQSTPEPIEQPTPEPIPDYASMYSYLIGTYIPEDSIADHNYTGYDITIKQIKGDQVFLSIESWDNAHIIWNQETYGTIQGDKIYFETIWKDKWRVGYGVIYIPQDANFTSLAFELVTTGENAEYLGFDSVYMDTRGLYYMILDNPYAN